MSDYLIVALVLGVVGVAIYLAVKGVKGSGGGPYGGGSTGSGKKQSDREVR